MIFLLGENVPTWWPCPAGSWTVLCRNHTTIGLGACARQHLASNNGGCVQYQVLEVEFLVFQGQTSHLYPPNFQHKTGRELSNLCEVLYLLSKLLTRWLRESPSTSFCLSVSSVHEDPASGLAQVQSCGKEGGECFLSLTRRGDRFVLASAHIAAGMPSLERVLHASARWHRSGAGVAQASCTSTNWRWRSGGLKKLSLASLLQGLDEFRFGENLHLLPLASLSVCHSGVLWSLLPGESQNKEGKENNLTGGKGSVDAKRE